MAYHMPRFWWPVGEQNKPRPYDHGTYILEKGLLKVYITSANVKGWKGEKETEKWERDGVRVV